MENRPEKKTETDGLVDVGTFWTFTAFGSNHSRLTQGCKELRSFTI